MKARWTLSLPQTSRANPVQCCSTHQKKKRARDWERKSDNEMTHVWFPLCLSLLPAYFVAPLFLAPQKTKTGEKQAGSVRWLLHVWYDGFTRLPWLIYTFDLTQKQAKNTQAVSGASQRRYLDYFDTALSNSGYVGRERESVCVWERECVCVRERECVRETEWVCVRCLTAALLGLFWHCIEQFWVHKERERERERLCVCVCVRERECVCVCVRESVCVWERDGRVP